MMALYLEENKFLVLVSFKKKNMATLMEVEPSLFFHS